MHILLAAVISLAGFQTAAPPQTPPQTPPPATTPAAPKKPAQTTGTTGRDRQGAATRPAITVTVTNMSGQPIEGVAVRSSGPVDRQVTTDPSGTVVLRSMAAGTYRLRFEHPDFIMLEREVTHGARATNVNVALNMAPKPVAPPEPPPKVEAPAAPVLPPAGPPTFVSIPDFVEKNYVGGNPSLSSPVGCVPSASSKVVQLREPLAEHTHQNADELIYVVAGEGTHKIKGNDIPLEAGMFVTVPRGTPHSITRKGRNPIILLTTITEPCQQTNGK